MEEGRLRISEIDLGGQITVELYVGGNRYLLVRAAVPNNLQLVFEPQDIPIKVDRFRR